MAAKDGVQVTPVLSVEPSFENAEMHRGSIVYLHRHF